MKWGRNFKIDTTAVIVCESHPCLGNGDAFGQDLGYTASRDHIAMLKHTAYDNGWRIINGRQMCPDCVAAIKITEQKGEG